MPTPHPTDLPPADDPRPSSALVPLWSTGPDDAPTVIGPGAGVGRALPAPQSDADLGLRPGDVLGGFEVLGEVGSGGMAAVLKAIDRELGRVVALKILPPLMARDPDSVTRFKQEGRAAARLDHDNVARVFACGEDRGLNFIAFEFVEGDNLRALIERRGPLPPDECIRLMAQVAAGLAHAASRGVVHRDIKPSNIVVTPAGRAKIVDMGLARSLTQAVNGGVTQSGVTLGTFDYISPEQAIDPRRADVRSDIYSLGCAFYHALTGRPPVPEGTAARKLQAHQNDPVLDPRVLNPLVPDGLALVLALMMAKDPRRRYQTPGEVIADLAALAPDLLGSAESLSLDPALAGAARQRRDGAGVWVAAAAGAVAVALIAAFTALGSRPADPVRQRPFDPEPAQPALPAPKFAGDPVAPVGKAVPTAAVTSRLAETAEAFAAALANPAIDTVRLVPGALYDLTKLPPVVAAATKRLTIEPGAGGAEPPRVLLAAGVADPRAAARASLVFPNVEAITVRGVHFVLSDAADPPPEPRAGLVVLGGGSAEFRDCRFEAGGPSEATEAAAVAAIRPPTPGGGAIATFRNCLFGQRFGVGVGVRASGPGAVELRECAFAPHAAAVALGQAAGDAAPTVTLRHCSFLLDKGAVVEADEGVRADVRAGFCVFATAALSPTAMMMMDPADPRAAVVRTHDEGAERVALRGIKGEPNAYYRVDPLATSAGGVTWAEARANPPAGLDDDGAAVLTQAPWNPPDQATQAAKPSLAFRLKTSLPALRVPQPDVYILGAKELPRAGVRLYDPWPPAPADRPETRGRVLVAYPQPDADESATLPRYVYPSLAAAVAAARPGDTIQIRHDGRLDVAPLDLPPGALTIQPFPNCKPILFAPGGPADGHLFRVSGGRLTLDALDIRVKSRPDPPGRPFAVVSLTGAAQGVTLKGCTVTLEEAAGPLAAVRLTPADGATDGPAVTFERCLVRGAGAGVRGAGPFDLTARDTVFALAGPVADIAPPPRPAMGELPARVTLEQCTALLAGPLLKMNAGRTEPSGRVQATASRCLFAYLGGPLAAVTGGDPRRPESALTWKATQPNAYANFPPRGAWLEVTPADDTPPPRPTDAAAWFQFANEDTASAGPLRFARTLAGTRLARLEREDLAPVGDVFPAAEEAGATVGVSRLQEPGT